MTICDALLNRVCDDPDSPSPNDLVWAAYMEMRLSDRTMPTSEQLDALASDWRRYRAEQTKEPTHA